MASSSEKTYWQLISESKAKAATSLRKYREQMKIELDKYESHLKDIDSSLERVDSTSYFIRGRFGTSLNDVCEAMKGQSDNVKKYTDTSVSLAMDDVCRVRSNEETISLLEQGKLVKYESVGLARNEVLAKLRSLVKANNPNADVSKIDYNSISISSDGTVSYEGVRYHDERLSSGAYRERMTGFVTSDIGALKAENIKLKREIEEYASMPIIRNNGQPVGIGTPISVAKYAPAPPTSLQVVTAVAKYAPISPGVTAPIIAEVAKYAPAPAITAEAAKYAPAPAITPETAKYAPAPKPSPKPEDLTEFGTYETRSFTTSKGVVIEYKVYLPKGAEKMENLPAMLYLHGYNESYNDPAWHRYGLSGRLEQQEVVPPGIVIVPHIKDHNDLESIKELTDYIVKQYSCDTDRISIGGHSYGGIETYKMIDKYKGYFSAAVPISGTNPESISADSVGGMKIWAFGGKEGGDSLTSTPTGQSAVQAIKKYGGEATFTYLPCEHGLTQDKTFQAKYTSPDGEEINPIVWAMKQRREG